MPRLPRIRVEGAIYFVTSRAVQNEEIFKDRDDYKMYLDLVSKYKGQHKFKLYSYCLLPDRLELLVETGDDASISEIMHDINSLYTKYFNGRYQKRGHLFESRFRSVLVEKAHFLVALTRHVHLAPWRHQKTYSQPVKEYPYSSFHVYIDQAHPSTASSPDMKEEVREVLNFLKTKDDTALYEKYVLEGNKKEIEFLEKSLKRGQVLGSDDFKISVKRRVEEHVEELREEAQPAKLNRTFLFFIGGLVLFAIGTSIYLYVSKESVETRYAQLLKEKEEEFAQGTRFENMSPLALTELDGTDWRIDLVSLPAGQAKEAVRDTVHFSEGFFWSDQGESSGFGRVRYSVLVRPGGLTTWEAVQKNSEGEVRSWRGDWQADHMKGLMRQAAAGKIPQPFSFYSVGWSYASETSPEIQGAAS